MTSRCSNCKHDTACTYQHVPVKCASAREVIPIGPYSDLVAKLRSIAGQYDGYNWHCDFELQAADAIEKLLAELEQLKSC
jgi:hypothetical protein